MAELQQLCLYILEHTFEFCKILHFMNQSINILKYAFPSFPTTRPPRPQQNQIKTTPVILFKVTQYKKSVKQVLRIFTMKRAHCRDKVIITAGDSCHPQDGAAKGGKWYQQNPGSWKKGSTEQTQDTAEQIAD